MKANQPKRKVFNDAIDLLTGTEPEGGVQMLPIDAIIPFHEHPLRDSRLVPETLQEGSGALALPRARFGRSMSW